MRGIVDIMKKSGTIVTLCLFLCVFLFSFVAKAPSERSGDARAKSDVKPTAGGERKMALKAGAGVVDITPPVGTYLSGGLRERNSNTVGSPLYARALILDNGEKQIGFIALDLLAVNKGIVADAGKLIKEQTGMNIENIMVSASHTHNGPYVFRDFGGADIGEKWLSDLPKKMAEAVSIAYRNLEPAKIGAGSGYEDSISHNRRMKMKDGSA